MAMVSMDINWRKDPYPLYLRAFISLIVIAVLYILIIRPVRIKINTQYIYPKFSEFSISHNVELKYSSRRIDILKNGYDVPRGFGIPFGGYFWLPLALYIAIRNKDLSNALIIYHLFLCLIPPLLGYLFIKGHGWSGGLLQVNEILFQAIFIYSLFLGLRGFYEKSRIDKAP